MADAVAVDIAKQVTSMLASAVLSQAFVPERNYADFDLELTDEAVHVDVVAVTTKQTLDLASRGQITREVPIDVALRKRFPQSSQDVSSGRVQVAEIDAMMLLAEEIASLLVPQRLGGAVNAVWQSTELLAMPVVKHIRELRQFTAIIRTTFTTTV